MPHFRVLRLVARLAASVVIPAALLTLSAGSGRAATAYNWLQFDGSATHSGNNVSETTITASNVSLLRQLFSVRLPAAADGAPVVLTGVSTSKGVRDLLFVTTKPGGLLALDAHTGSAIWSVSHGSSSCRINNGSAPCYTTSSPAIDPGLGYVYSYGLDGYIHKHSVGTGAEVRDSSWPELVTTKPFDEKESPALSIAAPAGGAGPYLYVGSGGYPGDDGDYQGHLTTINLSNGAQQVFNTLCSNAGNVHFEERPATPDCPAVQSAVWARIGALYDESTGRLFISTGNGDYNPGSHDWSDSVLAINPDGTGAGGDPIDSYTPTNFQSLQSSDADLGSTAPAILPMPSTSAYQHVAVQGGKDARLRLINLADLSGHGAAGHTGGEIGPPIAVPQGGQVLTQPAVWVNPVDGSTWVFVANSSGTSALQAVVTNGTPSLRARWTITSSGTSPLIADGVLYIAHSRAVTAWNPLTGRRLWQSTTIGGIHWQSPVVANGVLYIEDTNGNLTAFTLPSSRSGGRQ